MSEVSVPGIQIDQDGVWTQRGRLSITSTNYGQQTFGKHQGWDASAQPPLTEWRPLTLATVMA
jgi:hypothetical protein